MQALLPSVKEPVIKHKECMEKRKRKWKRKRKKKGRWNYKHRNNLINFKKLKKKTEKSAIICTKNKLDPQSKWTNEDL